MSESDENIAEIEFLMEGFPDDRGHVDFSAFSAQVGKLNEILKRIDKLRPKGTGKKTKYRIVHLSHSSPATIRLQPVLDATELADPDNTINCLMSAMERIASDGKAPHWADRQLLDKIKSLTRPVGHTIYRSSLKFAGKEIALNRQISKAISRVLEGHKTVEGSIKGRVEAINVHGQSRLFYMYPVTGVPRVPCQFPEELRAEALAAIDNLAIVHGRMEYLSGSKSPRMVHVRGIDIVAAPSSLPRLKDLRGLAPDLAGGTDSVDYVRKMRNEWEAYLPDTTGTPAF